MKFEHIQSKKNVVADAISRLRMFGIYEDNNNEEVQLSLKDAIEKIIKEIYNINSIPNTTAYTRSDKLNLDLIRKEHIHDKFCKKKVKEIKTRRQLHSRSEQHPQENSNIKVYS